MCARLLAWAASVLVLAAAADMVGYAGRASLATVFIGAAGACLLLAGGYASLAHWRVLRWLALAAVVLNPAVTLVIFTRHPPPVGRRGGGRTSPAGHRDHPDGANAGGTVRGGRAQAGRRNVTPDGGRRDGHPTRSAVAGDQRRYRVVVMQD
jgi:hypothetical protein